MNETKLLIGGADVGAKGGATFERKSPITGEVVTRAAAASVDDVRAAIDAAQKAFPAWSKTSPTARRKLLLDAAAKLRAHSADFSRLCVEETGAIGGWGHFNTAFGASIIEEAAAMTTQIIGEIIPSDKPGWYLSPWPCASPRRGALALRPGTRRSSWACVLSPMPLACGNTVVLKASELCPRRHRLIVESFVEAGYPAGVVNCRHPCRGRRAGRWWGP